MQTLSSVPPRGGRPARRLGGGGPGDVALQPAADAPLSKAAGLLPARPIATPRRPEKLAALLNSDARNTVQPGARLPVTTHMGWAS
jgi:hypothetical protein